MATWMLAQLWRIQFWSQGPRVIGVASFSGDWVATFQPARRLAILLVFTQFGPTIRSSGAASPR